METEDFEEITRPGSGAYNAGILEVVKALFAASGQPRAIFAAAALGVFTAVTSAVQITRLQALAAELKAGQDGLYHQMVDQAYLESEEYLDLAIKAMERTIRTRNQDRIGHIARLINGAAIGVLRQVADPGSLLDALASLSDEEVVVLVALYFQIKDRPHDEKLHPDERWRVQTKVVDVQPHLKGDPLPGFADRLPFLLKRLESAGLLQTKSFAVLGGNGLKPYFTVPGFRALEYLEKTAPSHMQSMHDRGQTS